MEPGRYQGATGGARRRQRRDVFAPASGGVSVTPNVNQPALRKYDPRHPLMQEFLQKLAGRMESPSAPAATAYLVLDEPWPAMLRGIWGDMDRYRDTYWSRYARRRLVLRR